MLSNNTILDLSLITFIFNENLDIIMEYTVFCKKEIKPSNESYLELRFGLEL